MQNTSHEQLWFISGTVATMDVDWSEMRGSAKDDLLLMVCRKEF